MTNPNKRLIVIVLDRSGSMQSVKTDTEGGLRAFLAEQENAPGETLVTLRQFDDQHDTVFENVPLGKVPAFELKPRGMTALHDAVGSTINAVGEHLASMDESDRPGEVVVVILTDGHENASREFTGDQVKRMVVEQQDRWNWVFVFLGANQDAVTAGGRLGVRAETSLAYSSANTADSMTSAGMAVARGTMTGDYGFTGEERTRAGGQDA